jgi:nucleoside-triphosphatase THEP1
MIAGEAGTGKSATIEAVREAYQDAGYKVRGLAWTNAVVQDMKRDGFADASTIASEIMRQEKALANGTRARF